MLFLTTRLFPEQIVALFSSQDKELINFGIHALRIFLIFLPFMGFQIIGAGYFQAVGKPKQAIVLSLSRQVLIFIPALIILPRFFQIEDILLSGPVADLLSLVITGICLIFELKQINRKD